MPILKVVCGQGDGWLKTAYERRYHDEAARQDVIAYCLNPQKTPHGYTGGYAVNVNQAALEMDLLAEAYGKEGGLRLRHMILSFSKEELRKLGGCKHGYYHLNQIAQYAIGYYGDEYQIIYVVHEDSENAHIHIVMNTVNYRTGQKYGGKKADYYKFQNYMKAFLMDNFGLCLTAASDT